MVHIAAAIGEFFAILIRRGAWIMMELGLYVALGIAVLAVLVMTWRRRRQR